MRTRLGPALVASLAWHLALALVLLALRSAGPAEDARTLVTAARPALPAIVWLDTGGRAGGGGGGGNRAPGAPRVAERVGHDRLTVPVADPVSLAPAASRDEPPVIESLRLPAVPLASSTADLPGTIQPVPIAPAASAGPGGPGGSGTGLNGGDGPGDGPGVGPGRLGGAGGDDVYGLGAGIDPPVPIHQARPRYTSDAVRARAQGSVLVECVVRPTGICTDARVVRALQPPFGLDREAIAAAGAWRFRPGRRGGEAVAVRVTIEVAFTLR